MDQGMGMVPWVVAAVATLLAVVGWMRARAAGARADAAEKRLAEAEAELGKLQQPLKAPAEPKAEHKPEPAPKPKPAPKPAPEPEPAPAPPPAPVVEVDPAVRKRAKKLVKQARDMARFMDLDKQVEVAGERGYRVPIDLEDEQAVSAFEYLQGAGRDERFLLSAVQDDKGTFLIVKS